MVTFLGERPGQLMAVNCTSEKVTKKVARIVRISLTHQLRRNSSLLRAALSETDTASIVMAMDWLVSGARSSNASLQRGVKKHDQFAPLADAMSGLEAEPIRSPPAVGKTMVAAS